MVTTRYPAELGQAFATGRVNAMISSGSTGYDTKLWEHVKHFYDVRTEKELSYLYEDLIGEVTAGVDPKAIRVVRAPCMGRCATAPAARIGDREVPAGSLLGTGPYAVVLDAEQEPAP